MDINISKKMKIVLWMVVGADGDCNMKGVWWRGNDGAVLEMLSCFRLF